MRKHTDLSLSFFFRLGFALAAILGTLALVFGLRSAARPRYVTIVEKK